MVDEDRVRAPWERVETFPGSDPATIAAWEAQLAAAATPARRVHALVGRSLAAYWAAANDPSSDVEAHELDARRAADLDEALELSESLDDELRAEALLGALYGSWGPDALNQRAQLLDELVTLRPTVVDEELSLRILEWQVLDRLDRADLAGANELIDRFTQETTHTELVVFRRREVLWRGCVAMLEGRIDEAVAINQDAISRWADVSGSPFSFQNVAITVAIERFLRRGLADVIDAVRSIRSSSPRVGTNWDIGLAFTLSEDGQLEEAAELFERIAADDYVGLRRDLNWLVTMQLCGLIALTIDHERGGRAALELLRPFAAFDGTHGSGYASYGPVGRVVASLAARWGDAEESERWFDYVLSTRPPGPWHALTRHDRAVARSAMRPEAAIDDARTAAGALRELSMHAWAESADRVELDLLRAGHGEPLAELTDDGWRLVHTNGTGQVPVGVGASYLVALLAAPARRVDVAELDPSAPPRAESRGTVSESSLDHHARVAYRRRLDELDTIESPSDRQAEEAAFLRRELAGAKYVVATSAEVERARVRVTKAIRRAIDAIDSPALRMHFSETVSTGRTCSYDPPDGAAWLIRTSGR